MALHRNRRSAAGVGSGRVINGDASCGSSAQSFRSKRLAGAAALGSILPVLLALTACLSRSLTGLEVLPAAGTVSIAAGQTSQYQAVGVYTESGHATTSKDISGQVTWVSSNPAVATISSSGLATAVSAGSATITGSAKGSFGMVSATSDITVVAGGSSTQRLLTSLTVTPTTQSLTASQTAQLIAIGTYSSGSPLTQNLTGQVSWQSSDSIVATVNKAGVVTGIAPGVATVTALATATDGSVVTASSVITVESGPSTRVLESLTVTPTTQTVATNGTAQLLAIGTFSSGSPLTENLTSSVTWQTSSAAVATVNAAGLVTGLSPGVTTITALATDSTGLTITGSAAITVQSGASQRTLVSLTVIPDLQLVSVGGETSQFLAIGTYSSGSPLTQDLTNQVSWKSSDVAVGQINASGLVTAGGVGTAAITASATNSDGSIIVGSGSFQLVPPTAGTPGPVTLPTLTLYDVGSGTGTVTGAATSGPGSGVIVIRCGPSNPVTSCVASFPVSTPVTLTAAPAAGTHFDGWSSNCTPVPNVPTQCTLTTTTTNVSVGAIFDLN